jgi:hypothetical protein
MSELFDDIARIVASPLPRRRALRLTAASLASATLMLIAPGLLEAAPIKRMCNILICTDDPRAVMCALHASLCCGSGEKCCETSKTSPCFCCLASQMCCLGNQRTNPTMSCCDPICETCAATGTCTAQCPPAGKPALTLCCPNAAGNAFGICCDPTTNTCCGGVCCNTVGANATQKCCKGKCVPIADPATFTILAQGVDSSGDAYVQVSVEDSGVGLDSIAVLAATNATIDIPSFPSGTNAAVVVTATKVDQSQGASFELQACEPGCASGVCGPCSQCTTFDPLQLTVARSTGKPVSTIVTGIAQTESTVRIANGHPGLEQMDIDVNGTTFRVGGLRDHEVRTLDVAAAMVAGDRNTLRFTPRGKPGSADILITDAGRHPASRGRTQVQEVPAQGS